MKTIVCINTGTTNTCVSVWRGSRLIHVEHSETGVRDTAITGNKDKLICGIRLTLDAALRAAGISVREVHFCMATGMISSEMGLLEVPHVQMPVDLAVLAEHLVWEKIPEIADCPIAFVPGVKYCAEDGTCMDFMRGEETEAFGLIDRMRIQEPCVIVLPGSHCKLVSIGKDGAIVRSTTTLSGEMLGALSNYTILSGTLQHAFAEAIDEEALLRGAEAARREGITKACFQIRIMGKNLEVDRNQLANFLLGAVMHFDVMALEHMMEEEGTKKLYIAGYPIVTEAYRLLLQKHAGCPCDVTIVSPGPMESIAAYGAILLAEKMGLCV